MPYYKTALEPESCNCLVSTKQIHPWENWHAELIWEHLLVGIGFFSNRRSTLSIQSLILWILRVWWNIHSLDMACGCDVVALKPVVSSEACWCSDHCRSVVWSPQLRQWLPCSWTSSLSLTFLIVSIVAALFMVNSVVLLSN